MDAFRARAEQGDSDAAVSLGLLLSGSVLAAEKLREPRREGPLVSPRGRDGGHIVYVRAWDLYSEPGNGVHDDVEAHMWFNLHLI